MTATALLVGGPLDGRRVPVGNGRYSAAIATGPVYVTAHGVMGPTFGRVVYEIRKYVLNDRGQSWCVGVLPEKEPSEEQIVHALVRAGEQLQ